MRSMVDSAFAPDELLAEQWEKLISLIAHRCDDVSSEALSFLQGQMPSQLTPEQLEKFLAEHVQKIAPRPWPDPNPQPWSLDLLKSQMSADQLVTKFGLIMAHIVTQHQPVQLRAFEFLKDQLPSELGAEHVDHIVAILETADHELKCWTADLLRQGNFRKFCIRHWDKLLALLSDPQAMVKQKSLYLLEEKMPSEQIAELMEKFLPLLRSTDEWLNMSSRHLFEKKISQEVLAEHFRKIVPPLLADSELQSWSLAVLKGRISQQHLTELIDLIAKVLDDPDGQEDLRETAMGFMEAQLPSELEADHVNHVMALLENEDCKVKCWTVDFLNERSHARLLSGHWERLSALLSDASWEVQQQTFNLVEEKMPSERIAEQMEKFLPLLRSTDEWLNMSSRHLFEKKISQEVLSEHFEKIVFSLLADSELESWSVGFLTKRISWHHSSVLTELIDSEQVALDVMKDQLPSELGAEHVDHIVAILETADHELKCWTADLLRQGNFRKFCIRHWDKLLALLSDPQAMVKQKSLYLLEEKMPSEQIAELMEKFLPLLRSTDEWLNMSSRHLFEKKISQEVLAEHFRKIVPPLLADSELQSWSLAVLKGRISQQHLTELIDLIAKLLDDLDGQEDLREAATGVMEAQLPSELDADHVDHIMALLENEDCKVKCWTVDFLNERSHARLLSGHWERLSALMSDASWEVQQQTFNLVEEMPSERIAEQMEKFLPLLRSTDEWLNMSSRHLFEKKISQELLAEHFRKIVPPLLADSELQSWSLAFLKGRISQQHLTELVDLIAKLLDDLDGQEDLREAATGVMEAQLPSELDADHVDHIMALLENEDCKVKCWTVDFLNERSHARLLSGHWERLSALLSDASWEVQQQALNLVVEKMPSERIAQQMEKFLPLLRSTDARLNTSTRHLFEKKISEGVLAEHFQKIVPPLLADSELQSWSFGVLTGRISPTDLVEFIDWVAFFAMEQQSWERQEAVLEFMKEQLPEKLQAEHVGKMATLLANSECKVKTWTLALLHHRMPSQLLTLLISGHGEILWPLLEIEDPTVTAEASAFILRHGLGLSPEQLAEHSPRFASLLLKTGHLANFEHIFPDLLKKICPQHELAMLLHKLPVSSLFVARSSEDIVRWRDAKGNTWLHLAAAAGHLEACEALVDQVGLPLREKNEAGDEPLTLASSREVDRFLRSRMHFRETRFGYGNAFEEMMRDERQVSEVAWYTVPLPDIAGHLGGLHSFLVVTVSGTSGTGTASISHGAKRYVLEKAAGSFAREAHQKHGIFIGSQDLSSNLESVVGCKIHKMKLTLSEGSLRSWLKMKELYELAHGTGPYDLASSNCHHAAQKVFNHCCAREEDKEVRLPNEWLATLGAMFGGLFGSASSGSEGSGSDLASVNSEVASGCQVVNSPSGFTRPVDLCRDAFAEVAASLSLAVYQEDAAMFLKQAEAGTVSIRNQLGSCVLLHCHDTQARHRVEANMTQGVETAGVEKIFVDVYAVAWVPGLYPWRCLGRRQAVWSGHAYELSTDFRDDVVLQEVVSFAPNQPVEVLHATQKSGSKSPVQWLLARSGSFLYTAFRGTDDMQDLAIDISAVPDFHRFKELCIGVHSGIAHALEQEGDEVNHVVHDVLQALDEHRLPGEGLVLCGHSLGGGYAQVMAIHLLSRNVDIAAIRTFGAPHVLVPPKPEEFSILWQTLNSITQHWVHDWDPVPRLPLCKAWLTDVLPKLKQEVVTGIRVGIAQKYIQGLQQHCNETRAKLLERYDVAGEVVVVSKANSVALRASAGSAASKDLLCAQPPESVMTPSRLFAYHSMEDYLRITRKLTAS